MLGPAQGAVHRQRGGELRLRHASARAHPRAPPTHRPLRRRQLPHPVRGPDQEVLVGGIHRRQKQLQARRLPPILHRQRQEGTGERRASQGSIRRARQGATSNYCFYAAANHIRRGEADIIIAGGTAAAIIPIGLGGFVACVLVMESLEHAMKRDAPIIAEYLGGAVNCDAYHMTDPRSDGLGVWVYHPVSKRALKMQVLHLRR
ncbi:putative polyketide beta-ketoacyl synthase 1 isoform X1 [Panicum virgatum]|uniref:putative polyketide beta-ketoacyl synthase 1 isoform X1 n=1 Tax=Panicum virgatum TaxID=38727 RepID=UPI0019D682FB|nr:putative polyketide beta-ketoacyl synthase 1 isoform X1 [Panicum virgatum]XP_039847900.1 putative polyketide beta-ketoacyl synthase 1 isoform X1 [Panicum virgatum]